MNCVCAGRVIQSGYVQQLEYFAHYVSVIKIFHLWPPTSSLDVSHFQSEGWVSHDGGEKKRKPASNQMLPGRKGREATSS